MVALSEAIASNERIASTFPAGLIAVFVGGTSGVGEYTLKKLAKYATKPRIYIVGRSQEAADRIINECKTINPDGKFEFIKADISLIKSVDDVCRQIRSKETAINILFESQGSMAFAAKTSEGLPLAASLAFHSRIRFILNLLPQLQAAKSLRRVVSVMAATCEGAIDLNDIPGADFSLLKRRDQFASIETLLLEETARRAPDVSFIHTVPGVVKSGILRDAQGFGMAVTIFISRLMMPLIETKPDECGERHVFMATSARYAPGESGATGVSVPLLEQMVVARGTNSKTGSGMYSVDVQNESASPKVENILAGFRKDGTAEKVWNHIMSDCKQVTGLESI